MDWQARVVWVNPDGTTNEKLFFIMGSKDAVEAQNNLMTVINHDNLCDGAQHLIITISPD